MANNNNMLLLIIILIFTTTISIPSASSQLTPTFYANSCPSALDTIRAATRSAINREARIGAFLLRLFFHDCFVNGCDGSVLLDDIPGGAFTGEQSAPANSALLRNLDTVDNIKTQVDRACGVGVVSCADILAVATRDAVVELGGPTYSVPVGRRDARAADLTRTSDIPAFFENVTQIIKKFRDKGFTPREMVALSGAHSVGRARCPTYRDRIYDVNANIDPAFRTQLQANCPNQTGTGNTIAEPLDPQSPNRFGNNYFQALMARRGLLNSDQVLFNNGPTDDVVRLYAGNINVFYTDFANAMFKMGNLSPLTGTQGEIRTNCGRMN